MIPYFVIDQIVLGPIKLYTWGLFVGLGFSAGYLLFYYLVYPARNEVAGGARRVDLSPAKITGLALTIFVGAILGAKILAVAFLPSASWQAIFTAHSGASFMGGLVGAIVCGWGYIKIFNSLHLEIPPKLSLALANPPFLKGGAGGLNFWAITDLMVLPIALGIGIGRIGCVLINDHQGAITSLPWGILWPDGLARHPVAIYEALVGFGLLAMFWWIRRKLFVHKKMSVIPAKAGIQDPEPGSRLKAGMTKKRKDGRLFLLFLIAYSALRFLLDFTRASSGPLADPRWEILSVSQWLALVIFLISLSLFIYKKKC
ncbi:prolipoprotein diacylglyceryl transferase [Patescibacteria group bacterium]|nr:prolipoprotein diacylglyceryl transferase [Patescibacteria group bacterium]MBU2220172.1 prolipoprotein diacylglyceryl transferase [Patescibacteria group bacterium]MBU2264601.1 prolipoprotein diacylglyceryl transferase [Patescibacteria group bacterium]